MRVLVAGAGGMLGADLVATAPAGVEVTAAARHTLDVRDPAQIERVLDAASPQWVINAAAYTAVDRAETEREQAFQVNADAPGALARACARRGIALVHYGTDYVFPGDGERPYAETDPVAPVNAYGESKLAGERAIAASGARALVLRTQWLFGLHGRSFPRTMWERAMRRQATRVVNDQLGRPTCTIDLASATWRLVSSGALGLFHVANSGIATWYDVAAHVFARAGAPELVSPCTTADYPTPARRPRYSVLDTTKLESVLGAALPSWRGALDGFLAGIGAMQA